MNYKNRGMMLESIINKTIKLYKEHKVAIFHKLPLTINFSGVSNDRLKIKEGWIAQKSYVDYYGVFRGIFIAFEAKSTNLPSLPLSNLKNHQIAYLEDINSHGGVGFIIVGFNKYNEYFLLTTDVLEKVNKKSISIEMARQEGYAIDFVYPGILDFIPILEKLI